MWNYSRKRQIQKYQKSMNDVVEFAKARPNVNYRHFFKPSKSLGPAFSEADFRNSTTYHFQLIGREDAKTVIDSIARQKRHHKLEQTYPNAFEAIFNALTSYFNWLY